jgi:hypothetical protein
MQFGILTPPEVSDAVFLLLVGVVAALASFTVFLACLYWFRREQRRLQRKVLHTIAQAAQNADALFVTGRDVTPCGELVAQIKVRQGKQVVSVFEAEGRRFIHIDGELSAPERARMVRYLKSEGFMS